MDGGLIYVYLIFMDIFLGINVDKSVISVIRNRPEIILKSALAPFDIYNIIFCISSTDNTLSSRSRETLRCIMTYTIFGRAE